MPRYEQMSHPRPVSAEPVRLGDEDPSHTPARRAQGERRRRPVDNWTAGAASAVGSPRRRERPVHDWLSDTPSRSADAHAEAPARRRSPAAPARDDRLSYLDWDAPEDWETSSDHRDAPSDDWDAPSDDWDAPSDHEPPEDRAEPRSQLGTDMVHTPALVPAAQPDPASTPSGRRTIQISGRGAEGARGYERAMRTRTHVHRGPKPDRVAMWAVLLGIALAIGAATSSHAAVLAHISQIAPR